MSTTKIQILTNAYHDYSSIHGNKTQIKARKINQKDFKDNQVKYFNLEDYLENFKDNQVKYFNLEDYLEELEEEVPINTITIINLSSNKEYNFTIIDSLHGVDLNRQIYNALNQIKDKHKNVLPKDFKEGAFIEDVLYIFYEHKITIKYTPKNYKFGI